MIMHRDHSCCDGICRGITRSRARTLMHRHHHKDAVHERHIIVDPTHISLQKAFLLALTTSKISFATLRVAAIYKLYLYN